MKAITVDDEPLARSWLTRLLQEEGVTVLGEAQNAPEGLKLAKELCPDIVFLDVAMPGPSGIATVDSFANLEHRPLVVLVTAHPEHAVEAFRQAATDYLIKPVSADRLRITLARAEAHLARSQATTRGQEAKNVPPNVLPVRAKGAVRLVPIHTILAIESSGGRSILRTRTGDIETSQTLAKLESLLPDPPFIRIHASCIVNLTAVREILLQGGHSYSLRLTNGMELPISRQHYGRLCEQLRL